MTHFSFKYNPEITLVGTPEMYSQGEILEMTHSPNYDIPLLYEHTNCKERTAYCVPTVPKTHFPGKIPNFTITNTKSVMLR